jgi:hypothetical protein
MSDLAPKKPIKSNNPGTGTVFDVKRPGRTPAQTTSRPLIAGHKPIVRDPFTVNKPAIDGPLLQAKQKVTIQTPEAAKPAQAPTPVPEPVATPAPTSTGPASPELAAVAAELAGTSEPTSPEPKSSLVTSTVEAPSRPLLDPKDEDMSWKEEKPSGELNEAPKDFVIGSGPPVLPPEPGFTKQAPLSPEMKKEMEAATRDIAPAPDPDGVVVSGDHGPLNMVKVLLWFVAVIALVIVVGDVLLDAGTITTSVNIPHTHFIK